MKIDEAIEILRERHRIRDPLKNPDYEDALLLGIEALKRLKLNRLQVDALFLMPLAGETEE